ncbi:hypothetical protein C8R42DRAFT_673057 [Lentinula raphanica]|nr:hypothetical protein C8R42DRAFT_673057 [Lentinula raphanica]
MANCKGANKDIYQPSTQTRHHPTPAMFVALPPGLYEIHIHNDDRKKLLAPSSPGEVITVGTIKDDRNVWQISGDGRIISFSPGYSSQTSNNPSTAGSDVVTDKEKGMRWIICRVESNVDQTWTGCIMTGDATGLYWTLESGTKIVLRKYESGGDPPQFCFTPVMNHTPPDDDKMQNRVHIEDSTSKDDEAQTEDTTSEDDKAQTRATIGRETFETFLTLLILVLYKILEWTGGKPKISLTVRR